MKVIKFLENNILYYKILYIVYAILSVTILREIPYFTQVFSLIMVFLSFIYFCVFIYNGIYMKMNKSRYLLILFLLLQCSTFFVSKNYISDIIRLVFNGIYFLIISINIDSNRKDANKIFKITSLLIFTVIIISFIMYFFNLSININSNIYGKLLEAEYYKSFVGITVNSNTIGILSSFLIIFSIHLLINKERLVYINYFYIVTGIASLVLSGSRGAILMFLIYIIMIFILSNKRYLKLAISIFAIASIGIIIYYLNKSNIDAISTGRSILWENAINIIKENKVFGVGTTSFVDIMKENSRVSLPGIEAGGLHNIYIQIALCNGLIAFFVFIIFIIISLIMFFKKILCNNTDNNKFNISLFSILISILSLNLFESTLIYICSFIALIFWICIGELFSNLSLE